LAYHGIIVVGLLLVLMPELAWLVRGVAGLCSAVYVCPDFRDVAQGCLHCR